ncbi:MAG: ABC transporter permease subunit [Thermoleophilia bacterium]|nr:ABC transporter permease subunit [Thermoleophilia bacterium]
MKTWALAIFTLRETIRTRTMIIGLALSFLYLAFVPVLSSSRSGPAVVGDMEMAAAAGRDFLGFALGGINFMGMMLAIFTTLGAIYTEVDKGTILAVVTKPIHRWQVIFGKWLGHALLMGGYSLIMGLVLWTTVSIGTGTVLWRFLPAISLVCLNVIAMVSITLFFSTFLPVIANAIFVFMLFIFSSNLRIINAIGQTSDSIIIVTIANVLRLLLPVSEVSDLANLSLMGKSRAAELAGAEIETFDPRIWVFGYEMLYIVGAVLLASLVFRKKDLR